jgi:hypothetical protein
MKTRLLMPILNIRSFWAHHADDVLICLGAASMIFATFLWSAIGGFYVLGIFLIALGILSGLGASKGGGLK